MTDNRASLNERVEGQNFNVKVSCVSNDRDKLRLVWNNGQESSFVVLWLRDNCHCNRCRHMENGQRLFDISKAEQKFCLDNVKINADGSVSLVFMPEGHRAVFSSQWLYEHRYSSGGIKRKLWCDDLQDILPISKYGEVATSGCALLSWLQNVQDYGFAILKGVPTKMGEVTRVAEMFGYVRETNYGRFFDVKSVPSPINLAYTNLGLGVHTDNPYRNPVPGLQLLHCLENKTRGGESILVDGFYVAEQLRASPTDFALLTKHEVPFVFRDEHTYHYARQPLISINKRGQIMAVHYNTRSAAPFDLKQDIMAEFYAAYKKFGQMLSDQLVQIKYLLEQGDLILMDNHRVLHGRTAFVGDGRRHLQGCYADRDALESSIRVLRKGQC